MWLLYLELLLLLVIPFAGGAVAARLLVRLLVPSAVPCSPPAEARS